MDRLVLETPKYGWSELFHNERMRISYIDDAPLDMLENILFSLKNKKPFCITYDAEGYEWTLLSYDLISMECILRDCSDEDKEYQPEIIPINLAFIEFIENLISDVEKDIEEWCIFPASISIDLEMNKGEDTISKKKQKEDIIKTIEEIKNLLENFDVTSVDVFIDNLAYDMLNIAYESTTKKEHFVVNVKNDNFIYTVLSYDFYDVEVITRRNDNLSIKDLNTNMVDFLNSFIKSVIDNPSSFVESEKDLTKNNKIDKEIFETLATKVQDSFVNLWYKRN